MQFHQILVSASAGDAVTTAALELRDLLRSIGPSEVYARYVDHHLYNDVLELQHFTSRKSQRFADDVVIFHASTGEPEVTHFVASRPERLVVMYHNISPWERFLAFDPEKAGLLAAGRMEVASLAEKAELAITVSEYNARELEEAGYNNIVVVPLVVDVAKMRSTPLHEPTVNHLENQVKGPIVLYVGQLLPHKRPELLIKAYHILVTHLIPEAHLIMVGASRIPRFGNNLQNQVQELNLNRAWITGSVTASQLVTFYSRANMFATMSEHEGFCMPLIEAMGFGVPVLARDHAAIKETLGGAGVLLPPDDDPALAAEAMAEMITSQPLRKTLVEKGFQRVDDYDADVSRALLLNSLLKVVD